MTRDIIITDKPLDVAKAYKQVRDESCGGIALFVGTIRAQSRDKVVEKLEYESHTSMAVKEMEKIATEACSKWPVKKIIIQHRIGTLDVGDEAVIVAIACPHRAEAFEACRFIIDTLKETVPIWKKEVFDDGEEWVTANP